MTCWTPRDGGQSYSSIPDTGPIGRPGNEDLIVPSLFVIETPPLMLTTPTPLSYEIV